MQKKALTILLVLVIAMLLVAGCSKKESDTTLEGTWRITELVEDGEKRSFPEEVALSDLFGEDEAEEYEIDNDDEDEKPDIPDVKIALQIYFQLKDGTMKYFSEIGYGEKTWVILMDEGKYTVDGNTISITYDEEAEEDEEAEAGAEDEGEESEEVTVWTYVITGETINISISFPDEDDDDDTSEMTAVKVADSVVAEPVDVFKFLAELMAEILKNAPES